MRANVLARHHTKKKRSWSSGNGGGGYAQKTERGKNLRRVAEEQTGQGPIPGLGNTMIDAPLRRYTVGPGCCVFRRVDEGTTERRRALDL